MPLSLTLRRRCQNRSHAESYSETLSQKHKKTITIKTIKRNQMKIRKHYALYMCVCIHICVYIYHGWYKYLVSKGAYSRVEPENLSLSPRNHKARCPLTSTPVLWHATLAPPK